MCGWAAGEPERFTVPRVSARSSEPDLLAHLNLQPLLDAAPSPVLRQICAVSSDAAPPRNPPYQTQWPNSKPRSAVARIALDQKVEGSNPSSPATIR